MLIYSSFCPIKKETINTSLVCISNELAFHLLCFLHLLSAQWQSGKAPILVYSGDPTLAVISNVTPLIKHLRNPL